MTAARPDTAGIRAALPPDAPADVPAVAIEVFGDQVQLAERYVHLLATDGATRGLIGPREVGRLWERHLVNSAAVSDLLPESAHVLDVGSGAGLPGLALAIRRPDLRFVLIEPLQRRVAFLSEAVAALDLAERVSVLRGRAEEPRVQDLVGGARWVVARAVAPLPRLVTWCVPLLRPGGRLLAIKGSGASDELAALDRQAAELDVTETRIVQVGGGGLAEPTTVVMVRRSGERRGS